jgi:Secretion system C-terminal sorting domain
MKKIYLFSLLVASSLSYGQAFTATYDFLNVDNVSTGNIDPTPPPVVTGLTFGSFVAINPTVAAGSYFSTSAQRFSFPSQPTGATDGNDVTFTGAIDTSIYYQVTITPNAAVTYSLSGITFDVRRNSTFVRNYAVRSSIDGYAANLPASINPTNANLSVPSGNAFFWNFDGLPTGTQLSGSTVTLSGPTYTGLTGPVTFRFYGWNAEVTGGAFSIDNVVISGSTGTLSVAENNILGLKIYPNPAKNNLYIISDNNETKEVALVNVFGKVVLNTKVTNDPINLSTLTAGVYMVKVTEAGKTAIRKLVIQ